MSLKVKYLNLIRELKLFYSFLTISKEMKRYNSLKIRLNHLISFIIP